MHLQKSLLLSQRKQYKLFFPTLGFWPFLRTIIPEMLMEVTAYCVFFHQCSQKPLFSPVTIRSKAFSEDSTWKPFLKVSILSSVFEHCVDNRQKMHQKVSISCDLLQTMCIQMLLMPNNLVLLVRPFKKP